MDDFLESLRQDGDRSKAVSDLVKKGEEIVPALLDIFRQDPHPKLRRGLAYAVSRIASQGKSSAVKEFLQLAVKEENNAIKWFACYGLGHLQFLDTLDDIISCLLVPREEKSASYGPNDASAEDVRRCAAETLAKFGSKALPSVKTLLRSEDAWFREAAGFALTRIALQFDPNSSDFTEIKNILTDLSRNDPDLTVKNHSKNFLESLPNQ
ncbi:MAG: HEAT repeat domain-containing protein [Candidatus Hodarchaeota archaeon]